MSSKINRRSFIRNTALGSAGLMILPSMLYSESELFDSNKSTNGFIPNLMLISLIEDSSLLAFRSGKLSGKAGAALVADLHVPVPGNKGRLAGVLPPMDKRLLELVSSLKNNSEASNYEGKLSIAFGWTALNSAYKQLFPVLQGKTDAEKQTMVIHMDAAIIRKMSFGELSPVGAIDSEIEELLNAMIPRAITRTHTIKPDSDDGIGWVNRMSKSRRDLKIRVSQYAKAIANPDNSQIPAGFYDEQDAIITAARKLQKAQDVDLSEIEEAVNRQPATSLYARALSESYTSILLINDYLENKLSHSQLEAILFS